MINNTYRINNCSFKKPQNLICLLVFMVACICSEKVSAQKRLPSTTVIKPPVAEDVDCLKVQFPAISFSAEDYKSGTTTLPNTLQKSGTTTLPKSGTTTLPKSGTTTLPKSSNVRLPAGAVTALDQIAAKMKNLPDCRFKVSGHGASTKVDQQLSWDRVNAVVRYLVERGGISSQRLVFEYGVEGNSNTVDIFGTDEEGPNNAPPPHPNFMQQ